MFFKDGIFFSIFAKKKIAIKKARYLFFDCTKNYPWLVAYQIRNGRLFNKSPKRSKISKKEEKTLILVLKKAK
ncbi:MAG: hypothetical protein EAY66_04355 [Sphingobacteriales bacterium]|nr:MAG: hypothetical protein EAY66_04355 [Sphingobacteriales bacterium]